MKLIGEPIVDIKCGDCPFLCNSEHSSGCGAPFPIDHCEEFQLAMKNATSPMRDGEENGKENA